MGWGGGWKDVGLDQICVPIVLGRIEFHRRERASQRMEEN